MQSPPVRHIRSLILLYDNVSRITQWLLMPLRLLWQEIPCGSGGWSRKHISTHLLTSSSLRSKYTQSIKRTSLLMSVMSTSRNCTAGFMHLASRHSCQQTQYTVHRLTTNAGQLCPPQSRTLLVEEHANYICNLLLLLHHDYDNDYYYYDYYYYNCPHALADNN